MAQSGGSAPFPARQGGPSKLRGDSHVPFLTAIVVFPQVSGTKIPRFGQVFEAELKTRYPERYKVGALLCTAAAADMRGCVQQFQEREVEARNKRAGWSSVAKSPAQPFKFNF